MTVRIFFGPGAAGAPDVAVGTDGAAEGTGAGAAFGTWFRAVAVIAEALGVGGGSVDVAGLLDDGFAE